MQFDQLKRRAFISLLGGAPFAWPLAARAQQASMPVIGLLDQRSPDGLADRLRGFRQGLNEAGFVDGQNVTIEYRWAENQMDRLPKLADDLVRRREYAVLHRRRSAHDAAGAGRQRRVNQ